MYNTVQDAIDNLLLDGTPGRIACILEGPDGNDVTHRYDIRPHHVRNPDLIGEYFSYVQRFKELRSMDKH